MSERMHTHLRPGHLVSLTVGGDFTLPGRLGTPPGRDSKILLLSAGIGVTPMIAALRWLRQREAKRGPDSNRSFVSFSRAHSGGVCHPSCLVFCLLRAHGVGLFGLLVYSVCLFCSLCSVSLFVLFPFGCLVRWLFVCLLCLCFACV